MKYEIEFSREALSDIQKLRKAGDKIALKKLNALLDELGEHPTTGTGQPEQLKHDFSGCWSRRITAKHRVVYKIYDEIVTVIILASYGHYSDK